MKFVTKSYTRAVSFWIQTNYVVADERQQPQEVSGQAEAQKLVSSFLDASTFLVCLE